MIFLLVGLFVTFGSAYMFINAKKIVPPSRDPEWWMTARIMAPFAFFAGLAILWWIVPLLYQSWTRH